MHLNNLEQFVNLMSQISEHTSDHTAPTRTWYSKIGVVFGKVNKAFESSFLHFNLI